MRNITYKPIGIIHSPFQQPQGVPIQPSAAKNTEGTIEIYPEYIEGLSDIDGFSHIILIYHFHLVKKDQLKVVPFADDVPRGVFACRSPIRPNNIGISTVRLIKVDQNILTVQGVDIVDQTPILDIKPYNPKFDLQDNIKTGWMEKKSNKFTRLKADDRFL